METVPRESSSSQDGEGEVDEQMDSVERAAFLLDVEASTSPIHPNGLQGGPFLNPDIQAARMLPSVIEHQIGYGTRVKPAQQPVAALFSDNYYPPAQGSLPTPQPYYPPSSNPHPQSRNGFFSNPDAPPPSSSSGIVASLGPPPAFPPAVHSPPPPQAAPLEPWPAGVEKALPVPEDGRPRRDKSKRAASSVGPSEDGAALPPAPLSSRKGKEKERSHHHHQHGEISTPTAAAGTPSGPRKERKASKITRDVPADLDCSFCEGNRLANRDGQAEEMVACYTCGRAGHPSCLQMTSRKLINMVMSYDWRCIECKPCDICKEKGDDTKLLFCDKCDRGTHLDCLDPPLAQPPKGLWACGKCVPPRPSLRHPQAIPTPKPARRPQPNQYTYRDTPNPNARPPKPHNPVRPPQPNQYNRRETSPGGTVYLVSKRDGTRLYTYHPEDFQNADGSHRPLAPRIRLRLKRQRAESEEEDDDDDVASKLPFGGVLTGPDADTSKSVVGEEDKERFERSRRAAEIKLGGPRPPTQDPYASMPSTPQALASTSGSVILPSPTATSQGDSFAAPRPLREQLLASQTQEHLRGTREVSRPSTSGPSSLSRSDHTHEGRKSREVSAGPSAFEKIKCIRFGPFDIDTWYTAPYPEEYAVVPDGRLWICEFCLKYMKSSFGAERHRLKCRARHPPGDEVYRDGAVSVFEVDGRKNKIYCQNLCLLAKMFLDHKTLYYDVEPFLFYIMTETDAFGARFVGYFSKEKRSPMNYNVSCIMTLPVRQRKGWGNLLIDFSYLLSKKESRVGSPEKPLSDLGLLSYTNYWTVTLFFFLRTAQAPVTIEEISKGTAMTPEDILFVLRARKFISIPDSSLPPTPPEPVPSLFSSSLIPHTSGKASAASGPPPTASTLAAARHDVAPHTTAETTRVNQANFIPEEYTIEWGRDEVEAYLRKFENKGWLRLRPNHLTWSPFLLQKAGRPVAVEEVGVAMVRAIEGGGVEEPLAPAAVDEGGAPVAIANGDGYEPEAMVVDEEEAVVEDIVAAAEDQAAPSQHSQLNGYSHVGPFKSNGALPNPSKSNGGPSKSNGFPSLPDAFASSSVFPPQSQPIYQPFLLDPSSSSTSYLAPPSPSSNAHSPSSATEEDPATLALVAALASPNRRLRSTPTPSRSVEPQSRESESPRKRLKNGDGASADAEESAGAVGRETRRSPKKAAAVEEGAGKGKEMAVEEVVSEV